MMLELNFWLLGSGLILGLLFGLVVQRSRFCTLAALSNWVLMRDLRQVHGYLAALAVAVFGVALLESTDLVPISESIYRSARVDWLGAIAGGVVFGFGMVFAGGCVGRLTVRGAEGSASALCALSAVALGAAVCAYGVLADVRGGIAEATAITLSTGDASLTAMLGMSVWTVPLVVIVTSILIIGSSMRRNASLGLVLAGASVGVLVTIGWFVTGYLTRDEFAEVLQRPASLTFAIPLAQSMHFFLSGNFLGNGFYLALLIGVLGGAFASATVSGAFRWSIPASRELVRVSAGGLLMGVGAVFAGGCNIGQGLTGMSTLSLSALLAVTGMVAGMRFGLAWLLRAETEETDESSDEFRESAVNEAG